VAATPTENCILRAESCIMQESGEHRCSTEHTCMSQSKKCRWQGKKWKYKKACQVVAHFKFMPDLYCVHPAFGS